MGSLSNRPKAACIVVHNHIDMDPRMRREAEALLADGWSLDIVCLRGEGEPRTENWGGATVHRLPVRRHRGRGQAIYSLEYAAFFLLASAYVSRLSLRRRYDLIQAHNIPDFLVFTALLPRMRGARVLLDIRDPLPDLYTSKFGGNQSHPVVRFIQWLEAKSITFADHVLTPGEPSRRRLIGRKVPPEKVTNVLNSADPRLFMPIHRPIDSPAWGDRFTLAYHGGLFARYGLDIAIKAVHQLRRDIPGLRLRIAGIGEEFDNLRRLVEQLDLEEHVSLEGWISPSGIPEFVAQADLGVVPYRQDTFTDLIYPTKAFEYMAMGIPVIMSNLTGIVELFCDAPELFFRPDDVDDLARHIFLLYREPARLSRLNEIAQRAYAPYSWEGQRQNYLALVHRLVNGAHPAPPAPSLVATVAAEGGAGEEFRYE